MLNKAFTETKYTTPARVNLTRKQILAMYEMTKSFENINDFELHISQEATTLRFSLNLDQTTTTQVDTNIT